MIAGELTLSEGDRLIARGAPPQLDRKAPFTCLGTDRQISVSRFDRRRMRAQIGFSFIDLFREHGQVVTEPILPGAPGGVESIEPRQFGFKPDLLKYERVAAGDGLDLRSGEDGQIDVFGDARSDLASHDLRNEARLIFYSR